MDCDDAAQSVHPEAPERCDGVDQDCDGLVDEDATDTVAVYTDADGDGYGDADTETAACAAGDGQSVEPGDCDDADAARHPGAAEVCNEIDDDCDGVEDDDPTDAGVGYADADGDGHGDAGASISACTLPDGYVETADDCDDTADDGGAYIFYGGVHSGEESLTDADDVLAGEASADAAGTSVANLGDVDGDGQDDVLVSGHWNDTVASNAGRVYVISGDEVPRMGDLGDAWVVLNGESMNDAFGYYLGSAGDLDGDGLGDVLVGASFRDEGGTNAGKAYVFLADSLGSGGTLSATVADYSILGDASSDYLGEDVASAGDIDDDGLDDFVVGGTQVDDSGVTTTGPGHVYLFLGGSLGSTAARDATDADTILSGDTSGDAFGQAIGHGDFDGDNRSDLSITACYDDDAGAAAGANYIFLGADLVGASTARTTDAAVVITGDTAGDNLGARSTVGFDVDLDGRDDLFTGAIYSDLGASDAGTAALYLSATLLGASTRKARRCWCTRRISRRGPSGRTAPR